MNTTFSAVSTAIYHFEQMRSRIAELVGTIPREQLLVIPNWFSNSIAWHVGHVVVTQQLLVYGLSGLHLEVSPELVDRYRKGTTGTDATLESFDEAMEFLLEAPDDLRRRHAEGEFSIFTDYQTSAGIELKSFEDALLFNNIHEGMHLGYMMGLRKGLGPGS